MRSGLSDSVSDSDMSNAGFYEKYNSGFCAMSNPPVENPPDCDNANPPDPPDPPENYLNDTAFTRKLWQERYSLQCQLKKRMQAQYDDWVFEQTPVYGSQIAQLEDELEEQSGGMPYGHLWDHHQSKVDKIDFEFKKAKNKKWHELNIEAAALWERWVREGGAADGRRSLLEEALEPCSGDSVDFRLSLDDMYSKHMLHDYSA